MKLFLQTLSVVCNVCETIRGRLRSIIHVKAPGLECVKSRRGDKDNFAQSTCCTRLFPLSSKETYVMLKQLENSSPQEIR